MTTSTERDDGVRSLSKGKRPDASLRKSPRRPEAPPGLAGISVLVVEDDAANRKLFALLLTGAGARVTSVASAEEAQVAIAERQPRVIVLDLVLPRLGGLTFVEQLKADPATRSIVVIAVTSLNGPEAERVALRAGCVGYLKKPIDTETFAATVAALNGGEDD